MFIGSASPPTCTRYCLTQLILKFAKMGPKRRCLGVGPGCCLANDFDNKLYNRTNHVLYCSATRSSHANFYSWQIQIFQLYWYYSTHVMIKFGKPVSSFWTLMKPCVSVYHVCYDSRNHDYHSINGGEHFPSIRVIYRNDIFVVS